MAGQAKLNVKVNRNKIYVLIHCLVFVDFDAFLLYLSVAVFALLIFYLF